jgi:hypothetical protein
LADPIGLVLLVNFPDLPLAGPLAAQPRPSRSGARPP